MSQTKEKTYLKWYNKVGYGSGDIAATSYMPSCPPLS